MRAPVTLDTIPAQPGFFALIYRDGNVARLPVVAWRINEFGAAFPAVAGNDEFNPCDAVQSPNGDVLADGQSATYASWLAGQRRQSAKATGKVKAA